MYNFHYKIRQKNADRFKTSPEEYSNYLNAYKEARSSRPQSARSKISRMSHITNINEQHYDCEKGPLSQNQVLELQMCEFVETQANFILDDFSSFAQIRMHNKPAHDT